MRHPLLVFGLLVGTVAYANPLRYCAKKLMGVFSNRWTYVMGAAGLIGWGGHAFYQYSSEKIEYDPYYGHTPTVVQDPNPLDFHRQKILEAYEKSRFFPHHPVGRPQIFFLYQGVKRTKPEPIMGPVTRWDHWMHRNELLGEFYAEHWMTPYFVIVHPHRPKSDSGDIEARLCEGSLEPGADAGGNPIISFYLGFVDFDDWAVPITVSQAAKLTEVTAREITVSTLKDLPLHSLKKIFRSRGTTILKKESLQISGEAVLYSSVNLPDGASEISYLVFLEVRYPGEAKDGRMETARRLMQVVQNKDGKVFLGPVYLKFNSERTSR